MHIDTTTLRMALIGFQAERQKIQAKIDEIQRQLSGRNHRAATPVADAPEKRGRRRMSAAARRRIAAAQKARWAAYRNQKTA
jgi:cell division septum initiation protein DivIVA